jgi:hypothetical protein
MVPSKNRESALTKVDHGNEIGTAADTLTEHVANDFIHITRNYYEQEEHKIKAYELRHMKKHQCVLSHCEKGSRNPFFHLWNRMEKSPRGTNEIGSEPKSSIRDTALEIMLVSSRTGHSPKSNIA